MWPKVFPGPEKPSRECGFMQNNVFFKIYVGANDDQVILFSAGNMQTIESTTWYCEQIRAFTGGTVITYNYPGYNESNLHQTDWEEVKAAAETIMQFVLSNGKKVHLWGQSAGCLPTCYLGSRYEVESITLESGFTSVSAMALPAWFTYKDMFLSNVDMIAHFRTKQIVVMHHVHDTLIPFEHAQELLKAAKKVCLNSTLIDIKEGDHKDDIDLRAVSYPLTQL